MTVQFHDGFIGDVDNNSTKEYSGSDYKDLFLENLNKKPEGWYYRHNKITYSHNNVGHRCKNTNEIDYNNYILFTGCSHTYGIGLELEKTYAYLLSKKLSCDYYNLALGGTGIDIMFHNLNVWLDRYPKPKHVFVQWSDPTRFIGDRGFDPKSNVFTLTPEGHWSTSNTARKFILLGDDTGYWRLRTKMYNLMLKEKFKNMQLSFRYISFLGTFSDNELATTQPFFHHKGLDYARDGGHFGNKTNEDMATRLYDSIQQ
jgi:hypothetical protein